MTFAELFRDALLEIAAIDAIDPTPPELEELARVRFNGILNQRNAQSLSLYAVAFSSFTTTPSLSPHTIGPSGATWTLAVQRPVAILGANMQIGSGVSLTNIGPLRLRDRAWWLAQTVQQLQSGVPTDLYYEPTWPNGSIYLWPVPNAAYLVQLEASVAIAEVAADGLTADFSLPPGYQRDLTSELAIDLSGPLSLPLPQALARKAAEARGIVQSNNNPSVRLRTAPGRSGRSNSGFNWLSRTWN